ncbi:MAG: hypothetical protein ACK56W_15155 [Pirellula sp.]|nr:hypothetical protein [Pirellula sp.]
MLDLNRELENWRKQFARNNAAQGNELDKLESRLLESYHALVQDGLSEQAAFAVAAKRMGTPMQRVGKHEFYLGLGSSLTWRAFGGIPFIAPTLMVLDMLATNTILSTHSGLVNQAIGLNSLWGTWLIGLVVSYLVALVCWKPALVFLRKRGWLNGGDIHSIGLMTALAACTTMLVTGYLPTNQKLSDVVASSEALLYWVFIIQNAMLSVLLFWGLPRQLAVDQISQWDA